MMRGLLFVVAATSAVVLCAAQTARPGAAETPSGQPVTLKANYDFGNYKLGEYSKRLILGCAIDGDQGFQHSWKWFHGEKQLKMDEERPHPYIVSGNLLIIARLNETTVGQYTCKLFNYSDTGKECHCGRAPVSSLDINVVMKPTLELKRVQVAVLEQPITIKCTVHGVPAPEITWQFRNTTIESSENVSISSDAMGNSILHITEVTEERLGEYSCSGLYATILPPVTSEPCLLINEGSIEEFVKTTMMVERLWNGALDAAFNADVRLHVDRARLFNAVLWTKMTGRWTGADEQWMEPFMEQLLDADVAVIGAKARMLIASKLATEARERNADPNLEDFSVPNEVDRAVEAMRIARELETLLAQQTADVQWLTGAVEFRSAGRKSTVTATLTVVQLTAQK